MLHTITMRSIAAYALSFTAIFGGAAHAQLRAQDAHVAAENDTPRLELSVGGGLEGFIGSPLRSAISIGETWTARVAYGKRKSVRVEAAYTGSRQAVDHMDTSATLTSNGAAGLVRINVYPEGRIEPFFFVGGGWTRFSLSSSVPGIAASDDIFALPIGFGGAYELGDFAIDVRASFTVATGPDLVEQDPEPRASEDSEMMHRYGVTASLGYSF